MIILGIDPGSALTGTGVIEFDGKNMRALNYRPIRTDSKQKLPLRLKEIYDEVMKEIEAFHPDVCSVENVFGGKNIRSTLIIGQARGAAIMAGINAGLEIAEYTPAEIKKSVISELDQIASVLLDRYRDKDVSVVGHTDSDPILKTKNLWKDNWQLSSARALAVVRYLVKKGIRASQLGGVAAGEFRPVASNSTISGKAKNRRVQIVVYMYN